MPLTRTPASGSPVSRSRTVPTTGLHGATAKSNRAPWKTIVLGPMMCVFDERMGGTSFVIANVRVIAIVGPETVNITTRSRPTPSSRNRPSGPVVRLIAKGTSLEAPLGGPRGVGLHPLDPGGQVAAGRVEEVGGDDLGAGDGPPFEVEDAALDRQVIRGQPHGHVLEDARAVRGVGPAGAEPRGRRDEVPGTAGLPPGEALQDVPGRHERVTAVGPAHRPTARRPGA